MLLLLFSGLLKLAAAHETPRLIQASPRIQISPTFNRTPVLRPAKQGVSFPYRSRYVPDWSRRLLADSRYGHQLHALRTLQWGGAVRLGRASALRVLLRLARGSIRSPGAISLPMGMGDDLPWARSGDFGRPVWGPRSNLESARDARDRTAAELSKGKR